MVEICPLFPTFHQLGRCHQGIPENPEKKLFKHKTKQKANRLIRSFWVLGITMSNCWNIEGCHLLICFFKKFPLVRKPCRHSTFAFLPCSMRTPQGAAQVETTSWNLKYRGACGSWYLPRRGCTLPSPNKILVATYPKQNKTTDKTVFCCNQFLNSVHIMHLTLKQSFSCDSEW